MINSRKIPYQSSTKCLMAKKSSLDDFPETFVSTSETTKLASKAASEGRLRKLASRLYSRDLTSDPETLVRRNLWQIVAGFFPDAIIPTAPPLRGDQRKMAPYLLFPKYGPLSDHACEGCATWFKVAGPGDIRSSDIGVLARISALNLKSQI